MCNPRKVMIYLTRCVEEAWRRTVEQTAEASGEVTELARVTAEVPLDQEMGEMALEMLERVLGGEFEGFEAWQPDSLGQLQRDLEGVTLIYDPKTRQLIIETHLTEMVNVEARGAVEADGFTVGQVATEAVGHYYEDGWGGRTEARAREEAQAQAEHKLEKALEALHWEQNRPALEAAEAEAQAQAQTQAQEMLRQRRQEVREALRGQLQATLSRAQERAYHVINRAVGEAYRQTLHQLVRENGGRVLMDEETGSVINIELELY